MKKGKICLLYSVKRCEGPVQLKPEKRFEAGELRTRAWCCKEDISRIRTGARKRKTVKKSGSEKGRGQGWRAFRLCLRLNC